MIHVVAFIEVKPGQAESFLEIFNTIVDEVRAEKGCLEYGPTVDIDAGLTPQALNPDMVTVIEKWESLDHLKAHLVAPHMKEYQGKVKDIVEKVSIKVLQNA